MYGWMSWAVADPTPRRGTVFNQIGTQLSQLRIAQSTKLGQPDRRPAPQTRSPANRPGFFFSHAVNGALLGTRYLAGATFAMMPSSGL